MRSVFLSLLFSIFAMLSVMAAAAQPSHAAKPAADATAAFTVGTLHVQQYGDHGQPVILIPGLAGGAWVWQDTIAHLRAGHQVYALTLAGFDGTPPPAIETGLMEQANASLLELIRTRHIDKPVLIGHSLGGTLAIRFATQHADLLGGVIAVDGLPIFPGMQTMTEAQRQSAAERMHTQMAALTPAQFKAQQLQYMQQIGVIDPTMAEKYAAMTARSDPAATAQYMAEDVAADDRASLQHIDVPLLEISPYYAPDFEKMAQAGHQPAFTGQQKADYYRQLLSGAPQLQVVSIAPSRHFVMLEQPQRFQTVIDSFLAAQVARP